VANITPSPAGENKSRLSDAGIPAAADSLPHLAWAQRPSAFYGWLMVGMGFILQAVGVGSMHISGLLISTFRRQLHATTGSVLLSTVSMLMIGMAVYMPLGGAVLRRVSVRVLATAGLVALAAGFYFLSLAENLWQLGAIYGVFLAGGSAAEVIVAGTLVSNWFVAKRGLALGIAVSGIMVGGLVLPPVAAWIIGTSGLRSMSLIFAAGALAIIPPVWSLVIEKPEMRGWGPDGSGERALVASEERHTGNAAWSVRSIFANGEFLLIMVFVTLFSAINSAVLANLAPMAESFGVSRSIVAYLISLTSLSAMVGMIGIGPWFNKVGPRAIATTPALVAGPAVALLLWRHPLAILLIYSFLIGLANGTTNVMPSIIAGRLFGRSGFSLGYGIAMLFQTAVISLAVPLFGVGFDVFGSYLPCLLAILILVCGLGVLAQLLPAQFEPAAE
jgi:MFS family permease